MMRNLNRFQRILVWILSFLFVLTLFVGIFKQSVITDTNKEVFNVVSAVRYTFFEYPVVKSQKWFYNIMNLENITEENRLLKENVKSIARNQAYIKELEKENQELIEMLEFKNKNSHLNLVATKVIFRDFERWNNTIKIDIGSSSKVKVNDAVLLPEGLIGRVESTEANSSIVRLLISNDKVSKVAVKINVDKDKYIEAIIDEFNFDEQAFELSLLETSDLIKTTNEVVTSGAGGIILGGILVGEIVSKEVSTSELGDKILVKPAASFDSFENVFVVVGAFDG